MGLKIHWPAVPGLTRDPDMMERSQVEAPGQAHGGGRNRPSTPHFHRQHVRRATNLPPTINSPAKTPKARRHFGDPLLIDIGESDAASFLRESIAAFRPCRMYLTKCGKI